MTDKKGEGCIDITTNASWNLSKDNPIYICTSSSGDGELEDSVKNKLKIDSLYQELTYTAKGENPNNWVEFEVISDSTKISYFPNISDKNLWRIISIDSGGKIKLIYPNKVNSNNNLNYTNESSQYCTECGDYPDPPSDCTYYKLKNAAEDSSHYYKYDNNNGFIAGEILQDVTVSGSKKEALYNAIVNNNWIVTAKYFPYYDVSSSAVVSFKKTSSKELKIGMLNIDEINSSINISNSWLYNYTTITGDSFSHNNRYWYTFIQSGEADFNERKQKAMKDSGWSCNKTKESDTHWKLNTYSYNPVITLSEKVDLVKQICPEGIELGSKECPYKLECKNC